MSLEPEVASDRSALQVVPHGARLILELNGEPWVDTGMT